jgi:tetratricopeptide (TPR) repeat protein
VHILYFVALLKAKNTEGVKPEAQNSILISIMNKIKCVIFIWLIGSQLQAQNAADYEKIDKQTYDFFIEKDWQQVINVGRQAITEGVDYYNLRYRIGVAFYEQKQFRAAISHFEKALIFNEFDETSKEYLYYAYLSSERFSDAEKLAKTMRKDTQKRLKIKPAPLLSTLITEGGIKAPNFDSLKIMTFVGVGLGHRIGDVATAFHNFSNVSQTVYYGKITQKEYYLGVTIPLKNGLTIQPVVHLIDLNLASTSAYVSSFHRTDFLAAVQATKSLDLADVRVNASLSNFYNKQQIQFGVGLTYYPLLNNQLALVANGTFQKDSAATAFIVQVGARYRPTPKLELSAHYYSGGGLNPNEMNGFLVNNSYDVLANRIGVMARYATTNQLSVYALGQFENRTESYYQKVYQNVTLAAGLQWVF